MEREEREILHRLDERQKSMEEKLDRALARSESNAEDIDELQGKVKRNTTIVTGITGGLGAVTLWVADKITRII